MAGLGAQSLGFARRKEGMSTHINELRRRMLDALDASEHRQEMFVGEPENTRTYGTLQTVVFRQVNTNALPFLLLLMLRSWHCVCASAGSPRMPCLFCYSRY